MRASLTRFLRLAHWSLIALAVSCACERIAAADPQAPAAVEKAVATDAAVADAAVTEATAAEQPVKKSETAPPKVVIPFPREPYRVIVEVGFDGSATRLPALRKDYVDQIRNGLDRMYGAAWNAQVVESNWLIPAGKERLNRLTADELLIRYPESVAHKVLFISISESTGLYQICCREYDIRVQELTPVLTEETGEVQNVANVACRLSRDSFRPVLLFAKPTVMGGELEFLLQAGELAVPDPAAAFIRDGDVLRTFLRQMDRRSPDKLKSLQRLDLCYVRVTGFNEELRADVQSPKAPAPEAPAPKTPAPDAPTPDASTPKTPTPDASAPLVPTQDDIDVKVEGFTRDTSAVYYDSGHVRGVLISHGPVPYGGAGRSVQQIALRQRPAATKSRVKLVLQARPDRPLICHRVDKVTKLRHTDANETASIRVLSDRDGEIELDVDPANPTFWLYVYSGSSLLARVPYAPGLIPEDTIKLPDDGLRLGVEGELYLFRDALVDTVAQRAVLTSLAKKASDAGKPDDVDKLIQQLDALPGQKDFLSKLNAIETPAIDKAKLQRNASVERKIVKLCQAMEDSLTAFYGSETKIKEAEELEKLRQFAERKAASGPAAVPGLVPASEVK